MNQSISMGVFKQHYERLNDAQRKAVDTIEGPVMVLAGPGTGKTQVLATRIATILLSTDTKPESILALTFTESAAKNMRTRLARMIGTTAYAVQIETFHSFCAGVIAQHPEYFLLARQTEPLGDLERYEVLEYLLETLPLEVLRPRRSPFFYLRDIQKSLSNLKREGVSPGDFTQIVEQEAAALEAERAELKKGELATREKKLAKQHELAVLYQAYQQRLAELSRYDYDDMISLVATAFLEHEELLLDYQENIQYFLVDEYQDTNSAQNKIVDILASHWGEAANVFVVGDPNQAIYRFQGASLENVLGFLDRYPSATVIGLRVGYRATPEIYQASATLISHNELRAGIRSASEESSETNALIAEYERASLLESIHGSGAMPSVYAAPSTTMETLYVAEQVAQLIAGGVAPKDIALLYRANAHRAVFADALANRGIPVAMDIGENILENECIEQLLLLCTVVEQLRTGKESGELYRLLLFEWFGLPSLVVMQVARAAHRARMSLAELLLSGYSTFMEHHTGAIVSEQAFSLVTTVFNRLLEWGVLDARVVFTAWFETVLQESGFLTWTLSRPDKSARIPAIFALTKTVRSLVYRNHNLRLSDFLAAVQTMREHGVHIPVEAIDAQSNAVQLSTVHKAKGQEWRYVFVVGLVDGVWGNTRSRDMIPLPDGILKNTDFSKKERNEDDRRLLYVAITRAKEQLFLSYPQEVQVENRTKEMVASQFLHEIQSHLQPADTSIVRTVTETAEAAVVSLVSPAPTRDISAEEQAYFSHLVSDFKLSVTALNTYLQDPQQFMVRYLLRVPEATSTALSFGTAVHAALEQLYASHKQSGEYLSDTELIAHFEAALDREILLSEDITREKAHGAVVLKQYYKELLERVPPKTLYLERFFGSGRSKTYLDDICLTGRIDRVDWIDEQSKTVRLIDYKTGTAKTAAEIAATSQTTFGKLSLREQALPEGIRGPLKRQLLFYKLLTELDPTFDVSAVSGVFEFVEPDKRTGQLLQREVSFDQSEVEQLKSLIREVMVEIRALAFLNQGFGQ